MTKLKLNKTSKKEIIINLRKSLGALCLCGSVISGISSFCISPLIINKIQNVFESINLILPTLERDDEGNDYLNMQSLYLV